MSWKLRVWRFVDGRPSHEKQTAGLLQGLQECLPIHAGAEASLDARDIALADHGRDLARLWQDPGDAPDLLIGAGRRTHWPMAQARWHLGSRTVLLMKPSLPRLCYDLALVPAHDSLWSERKVLRTLGRLGPAEAGTKDPTRGVILLGGANSHFHWHEQEVAESVRQIVQRSPAVQWQISDSPRSSQQQLTMLGTILEGLPNARLHHYADGPADWLTTELASAEQVWVSADSASMLYATLSAGARVGVIELTSKTRSNKLQTGIELLHQQRRVGLLSDGPEAVLPTQTEPLREHYRCAEWILQHWFCSPVSSAPRWR
jgi:mitochondrial fission protein ELM1